MPKIRLGKQRAGDPAGSEIRWPNTPVLIEHNNNLDPRIKSATAGDARPPLKIRLSRDKDAVAAVAKRDAFRFFDLPPEMRNIVYRELLIFTCRPDVSEVVSEERMCDPAILTTCRQAYDEAKSLLYEENRFNIDVELRHGWDIYTTRSKVAAVNGRRIKFPQDYSSRQVFDGPSILLRPSSLHLHITASGPLDTPCSVRFTMRELNHTL
ncbi:hypothetical protein LTR85_001589 [Meristemomyces frigidus]|nr:hypothetical protein LTR85_001589 [Meristemomyces frigidus]